MTSRVVTDEAEREGLQRFIAAKPLPFTVSVTKGKKRSVAQNRLQRQWLNEIAEQRPEKTAEEWRGYCKLHFGVGILKAGHEGFNDVYNRLIQPMEYDAKIELMMIPTYFNVTRLMTTKQTTEYFDLIARHFAEQGVVLTDPNMMGL